MASSMRIAVTGGSGTVGPGVIERGVATTASDTPTLELARRFHPEAKIRADLAGHRSFFDSRKADRLIGPTHDPARMDGAIDRRCA